MARDPPVPSEIDGFAGWTWRALAPEDLPIAWPLARLAGVARDLDGWLELAGRWLAGAAREGGGLGALFNPSGLLVALERHRPRGDGRGRGPGGSTRTLEVPWLVALEVTPEPRCLEALLDALRGRALAWGFRAIRLARSGPSAEALALLAARHSFEPTAEGWRWPLPGAPAGSPSPAGP